MFIQSKLIESEILLLDITIPESQEGQELGWTEVKIDINEDQLNGIFSAAYTTGFCITRYQFSILKNSSYQLSVGSDFIQISLMSKGISTLRTKRQAKKSIQLGLVQLAYRYECYPIFKLYDEPKNYDYTRIFISKSLFIKVLETEKWAEGFSFFNKVKEGEFVRFGDCVTPVDVKTFEILTELFENKEQGILTGYFLTYKIREFFLIMHSRMKAGEKRSDLPQEYIEKLHQARAILGANYSSSPTIRQLSKEVSLNEQKLKSGFRQLFGQTIKNYVTELRMDQAKKLIQEKLSVNEVAFKLGYKSASHFISSYKKRFGLTPKQSSN